jgi:hypothetical protein
VFYAAVTTIRTWVVDIAVACRPPRAMWSLEDVPSGADELDDSRRQSTSWRELPEAPHLKHRS